MYLSIRSDRSVSHTPSTTCVNARSPKLPLLVFVLGLGFIIGDKATLQAQDSPSLQAAEAARQNALNGMKQTEAIEASLGKMQAEIDKLLQTQKTLTEMQKALQAESKSILEMIEKQKQTYSTAQQELNAATTAKTTAKAALETAQKNLAAATKKKEESAKFTADAEAALKSSQTKLTELATKANELMASIEKSNGSVKSIQASHKDQAQKLGGLQKSISDHWLAATKHYQEAGTWVSFEKEVAPILHKRCLACHNEGKPRGQFALDHYSKMMQGGESGAIVDVQSPDLSSLVVMIEDGSMPKDDDPLSAEQVSSIKQWVHQGAQISDAALQSSPLIEIMPRSQFPNPPESYAVPIPVTALALSADGKQVASSGYHEVLIWSVETGTLLQRISGIAERVYDLEFKKDSAMLAVAAGTPGELGELKIIDTAAGKVSLDLDISAAIMLSVAFSPDQSQLAVCGADTTIRIFDTTSWKKTQTIRDHVDWINDIAWSPDGTKLVTASRDKTAKIFDLDTGKNQMTFNGHNAVVNSVSFLPDGEQIVSGGEDRRLRVWNLQDGKEVRAVTGFGGNVTDLITLNDGTIFSACSDQKVRRHASADTKIELTSAAAGAEIKRLAISVDRDVVVSGTLGGKLSLWPDDLKAPTLSWDLQPTSEVAEANPETEQ